MSQYAITFIGGPLDLTRRIENGRPPPYFRSMNPPATGPLFSKPDRPAVTAPTECADYEIIPFSRGPGRATLYIGVLMEVPGR